MLKVTLTGACGFIGSHLTKQLIADGFYVQGVDNLDDNLYARSIKENRLQELVRLDNSWSGFKLEIVRTICFLKYNRSKKGNRLLYSK
jgi:nucleoside-diphosphate-sugar epimerase